MYLLEGLKSKPLAKLGSGENVKQWTLLFIVGGMQNVTVASEDDGLTVLLLF